MQVCYTAEGLAGRLYCSSKIIYECTAIDSIAIQTVDDSNDGCVYDNVYDAEPKKWAMELVSV